MDVIDINQAVRKAVEILSSSGRIGKSEKRTIHFNGDINGKPTFETVEGFMFARISEEIIDLNDAVKVGIGYTDKDGNFQQNESLVQVVNASESQVLYMQGNEVPLALTINRTENTETNGFWMAYQEGASLWIEFAETIHPIDLKYLPGVCLPVVELSTMVPIDGSEITLTNEESAVFTKIATQNTPCIIKFSIWNSDSVQIISTVSFMTKYNEFTQFAAYAGLSMMYISYNGETWTAGFSLEG